MSARLGLLPSLAVSHHWRGVLLLCFVCHAILPVLASAGAATVVAYKGYEYRTLDGTAPTSTSEGCQDSSVALPPGGWMVVEDNADAAAVTAAYRWGTGCLVFANGRSIWAATGGSSAGFSCSSDSLSQSGNAYQATGCNLRILLSRPCAAGGYHDAMTTYAETATPTCTVCAAGLYSTSPGMQVGFPGCLQ